MTTNQYTAAFETLAQNAFADDVVRAIARRNVQLSPATAAADTRQHMSIMDTQERKLFARAIAIAEIERQESEAQQ